MSTPADLDAVRRDAAAGAPEACYRLGLIELQQNRSPERAHALLEKAAASGHGDARNLLGTMRLNGLGIPADAGAARADFEAASSLASVAAPYNLANLRFNGIGGPVDRDGAEASLVEAARGGHPPALRALALILGDEAGEAGDALLQIAAERGDMIAAYFHGRRLLERSAGGNKGDGMAWLALAAQAGIGLAYRHFMQLRAAGSPAPGAPAPRHPGRTGSVAEILGQLIPELPAPQSPGPRELNQQPHIAVADGLLSRELTDYLIIRAEPQLMDSETIHPETGERIRNTLRTSRSMNFHPANLDIVLGFVLERIASVAGLALTQAEPLAVLHYSPGQEYRPHYDYFTADAMQAQGELARGGQRVATVLTFLNDVQAGGETDFPELGLKVEARRGTSFVFANCDASGAPDPRSLHAGCPVSAGEKWVATLWFREQAYAMGMQDET